MDDLKQTAQVVTKMFEMARDGLTKQDFLSNWQNVIDYVKAIEKRLNLIADHIKANGDVSKTLWTKVENLNV